VAATLFDAGIIDEVTEVLLKKSRPTCGRAFHSAGVRLPADT
jgi:hypothetical protein